MGLNDEWIHVGDEELDIRREEGREGRKRRDGSGRHQVGKGCFRVFLPPPPPPPPQSEGGKVIFECCFGYKNRWKGEGNGGGGCFFCDCTPLGSMFAVSRVSGISPRPLLASPSQRGLFEKARLIRKSVIASIFLMHDSPRLHVTLKTNFGADGSLDGDTMIHSQLLRVDTQDSLLLSAKAKAAATKSSSQHFAFVPPPSHLISWFCIVHVFIFLPFLLCI